MKASSLQFLTCLPSHLDPYPTRTEDLQYLNPCFAFEHPDLPYRTSSLSGITHLLGAVFCYRSHSNG